MFYGGDVEYLCATLVQIQKYCQEDGRKLVLMAVKNNILNKPVYS